MRVYISSGWHFVVVGQVYVSILWFIQFYSVRLRSNSSDGHLLRYEMLSIIIRLVFFFMNIKMVIANIQFFFVSFFFYCSHFAFLAYGEEESTGGRKKKEINLPGLLFVLLCMLTKKWKVCQMAWSFGYFACKWLSGNKFYGYDHRMNEMGKSHISIMLLKPKKLNMYVTSYFTFNVQNRALDVGRVKSTAN